jgi:hypothetical protein
METNAAENTKENETSKITATPGSKGKDGSYIPAIVPPEWEVYSPTPLRY